MRVVIAGGGTGGHFYPGLAVATALQRQGGEVYWLGSSRGIEAKKLQEFGIRGRLVRVSGFVGVGAAAKLRSLALLLPAVVAGRAYLGQVRCQVVLSVGGYAALSGGLAAAIAGIPLVLQEQNAFPGVVHQLLAPWAAAIACGFPQTVQAFPSLPACWTGNPVRPAFFKVPPPPERRAILVMGGSQGSQLLNGLVPKALAQFPPGNRPQVIHQTGERWEAEVRATYQELGVEATVVAYLAKPWEELAAVPLVVARAGALTVCELAAARRAAVLIPFGQAAHGHQLVNAQALASTGAAWLLTEPEATPQSLAALLMKLLANPQSLVVAGAKGQALARLDATEAVVSLLYRAAGEPERSAA